MSHTFKGERCVFHYDSDYEGEVIIYNIHGQSLIVDCTDILNFVAEHIRTKRISHLEQLDWEELLK